MKYLSNEPFSSGPSTKEYREGWERIFGKNKDEELKYCIECGKVHEPGENCTVSDTSLNE